MIRRTHEEMVKSSDWFIEVCKKANCTPTKRQASKYFLKKGIVFKVQKGLAKPLAKRDPGFLQS